MEGLKRQRILVTRAAHQAEELAEPLRELGAQVLLLPAIEIAAPEDPQPLLQAAANCNHYDWIIFSSVNAVEAFVGALGPDIHCEAKIATVGEGTRRACEAHHLPVVLTPAEYVAEALTESFSTLELHDRRILIPSAAVTRDVIPTELRKMGALVHVVEAYRNQVPELAPALVEEYLQDPYPDWLTLASSSAAKNLVGLAGAERLNLMRIASIGPVTSGTARRLGLHVSVEAQTHDMAGLVDALLQVAALV